MHEFIVKGKFHCQEVIVCYACQLDTFFLNITNVRLLSLCIYTYEAAWQEIKSESWILNYICFFSGYIRFHFQHWILFIMQFLFHCLRMQINLMWNFSWRCFCFKKEKVGYKSIINIKSSCINMLCIPSINSLLYLNEVFKYFQWNVILPFY